MIGSAPMYASLRSRRVLGAARRPLDYADDLGLRSGSGYQLFEVVADPALILANEPLVIGNPNEGESAQRPQEIVLFVKS